MLFFPGANDQLPLTAIRDAYEPGFLAEDLVEFVETETEPDDEIACFYGGYYIFAKTGREQPLEMAEMSEWVMRFYDEEIDEIISSILSKRPGIVVLNLNGYLKGVELGSDVDNSMRELREGYVPVKLFDYSEWDIIYQAWIPRDRVVPQALEEPEGTVEEYVLVRTYSQVGGIADVQEFLFEVERDLSEPFVPAGSPISGSEMLRFPLETGTFREIKNESLLTYVFISRIDEGTLRVFTETYQFANLVSFGELKIDTSDWSQESLVFYMRLGSYAGEDFIPSYQQIRLTEDEYLALKPHLDSAASGNISFESYDGIRSRILPRASTQGLKKMLMVDL
jgi:hypothetical protein